MEEERPLSEARSALENEPTIITSTTPESNGSSRGPTNIVVFIGLFVVVCLIVAGLFLPPISLGERLGLGGGDDDEGVVQTDTADPAPAATTTTSDDTEIATTSNIDGAISVAVSEGSASANVSSVSQADFTSGSAGDEMATMADSLPAGTTLASDVYNISYEGDAPQGNATLVAPADRMGKVDVYGWDGSRWVFVPSTALGNQLITHNMTLPHALVVVEASAPDMVAVGAEVLPTQNLPADVLPQLTEVTAGTLTLAGEGLLNGEAVEVPNGAYRQYLRATNTGAVVDQVSLTALLSDDAIMSQHIADLVQRAAGYQGVNIDYQGIPLALQSNFTRFVEDTATALHANNQSLIVTVATPAMIQEGQWDTGGLSLVDVGRAADIVYLQMPLNPAAYTPDGPAEQLLDWVTSQVDRRKLNLMFSANAIDGIGGSFREVNTDQALANFGELNFIEGSEAIEVGSAVEVSLAGSASPLEWDGASSMYKYTYEENGMHSVWLSNAAVMSQRLALATEYNTRGATVRGLGNLSTAAGYASAISTYTSAGEVPTVTGAAIAWTVRDEADGVVASNSGEDLSFRWESTDLAGTYTLNAEFAQGDATATLGSLMIEITDPALAAADDDLGDDAESGDDEMADEEASDESGDEEEASDEEDAGDSGDDGASDGGDTGDDDPAPPPVDPGNSDAAVNFAANMRTGPGLGYAVIEVVPTGTQVSLTGRNNGADWFQVAFADKEGWIFGTLLNINANVDINALAVVEVDPPIASDDGGGGGVAPPPPPVAGGSFELGGQAFGAPYGNMSYAGMTWIKRQHKWSNGNTGQDVAGVISDAHNAGFKILLSMPGASVSSIDFGAYTAFLSSVASLPDPPDAIEVWNEMNIDREWPAGQISPQSYVENMLAPGYAAIKAANPNIMVISGAPAPTGFFGGCGGGGCNDDLYMAGMAAAGGASYMDCIGIHYNEGIISPTQQSGDPRNPSDHYTRYFWGMTNTYYNAFGGSRQLCYTELGYLSGEGFSTAIPPGFDWANNVTVAQQAQWLAEATSLSANSGQVRMLIVWNIDSMTWTSDPQAGYAIIRPGGGCPACETLRQVMGGG